MTRRLVGIGLAALALLAGVLALRSRTAPVERSAPKAVEKLGDHHWRLSRAVREEYFKTPARLNDDLVLQPTPGPDRESITDLKIARLGPDSPFAAAGFKVGDRILQLNDRPVTTLARALNLSQEVRVSDRVTVQVEREGKRIEYQFDFE